MEDYVFEDLKAKNLIQDILRQPLNTAEETLWCSDVFRDMELVPFIVLSYDILLSTVMLPYAECEMPKLWTFQHDNDPKHTARLVKTWTEESNIKVM